MELVDGFDPGHPGEDQLGPSAEAHMDMWGDTADTDLQVTSHKFPVEPEFHPGRGLSDPNGVLKRVMIEDNIVFHDFLPQFLAGINHVISPMAAQGPDKTDLVFF